VWFLSGLGLFSFGSCLFSGFAVVNCPFFAVLKHEILGVYKMVIPNFSKERNKKVSKMGAIDFWSIIFKSKVVAIAL